MKIRVRSADSAHKPATRRRSSRLGITPTCGVVLSLLITPACQSESASADEGANPTTDEVTASQQTQPRSDSQPSPDNQTAAANGEGNTPASRVPTTETQASAQPNQVPADSEISQTTPSPRSDATVGTEPPPPAQTAVRTGMSQESVCDAKTLENTRTGSSNGYQARGADRCEGLYGSSVSGEVLRVASLTAGFSYDSSDNRPLLLSWNAPAGSNVRLEALATKRDLYYRMDARPPTPGRYEWPSDMLRGRRIAQGDIGLLGVMAHSGGGDHDVFIPLKAAQSSTSSSIDSYELQVVPNVRMSEMRVTLAAVSGPGENPTGQPIKDGDPVRRRSFPERRVVSIAIDHSDLPTSGFYYVQISGKRANGRDVNASPFWFYHSAGSTDR